MPYEIYFLIAFVIGLLYLLVLIFNAFDKIFWARFTSSFGTVLWMSIYHICFGGFISQSLAVGAATISVYVAFRNQAKNPHILALLHLSVFAFALIYSIPNGPIIELIEYPIAALVSFFISMGWVYILLIAYNQEKNSLIQSLMKKNKELEQTTSELERFSYIASHDLKSPLVTIISFGNMIIKDIKGKNYDAVEEKMDYLISGTEQMKYLVEGILELSHVKSIDESERKNIDLNVVLDKALLNLKAEITNSNAVIDASPLPTFFGNEVEILLLFQNLIQNAIKYNVSDQPLIRISANSTKQKLSITFADNGIGIDEQHYDKIFEFFKRLHNSSEYSGTGMGLGLCKRIVENYNGSIAVESEVGKGTRFTLSFPLSQTKGRRIRTKNKEERALAAAV